MTRINGLPFTSPVWPREFQMV